MRLTDRRRYLTGMASVAVATVTAREATCAPLEVQPATDVVRSVRSPLLPARVRHTRPLMNVRFSEFRERAERLFLPQSGR